MSLITIYNNYGLQFFPFRLKAAHAGSGRSSIGGEPPLGILPSQVYPQTRYLGTLGLVGNLDASLFTTLDYSKPPSPFNLFSATGKLQDTSSDLVQFVVHPTQLARSCGSPLRSELTSLGFEFGFPGVDPDYAHPETLWEAGIHTGHKVGGAPFFDQLEGDVMAAYQLLREGYVHLLQLSFPSDQDDEVAIDWFFGDTTFHVFARKDKEDVQFRYIWR